MGNGCCRAAPSSMEWGGEDWDFLKPNNTTNNKDNTIRKTKKNKKMMMRGSKKVFDEGSHGLLLSTNMVGALRSSGGGSCESKGTTTMKIRISKRELKKLLGDHQSDDATVIDPQNKNNSNRVAGQASAEQVLLRLLKARDLLHQADHHTPWKPRLESIPEVN